MTAGGWAIMLISVGAVTVAFIWCIFRVLRTPTVEDRSSVPLEIEHEERE
jgi:hypothetical protein